MEIIVKIKYYDGSVQKIILKQDGKIKPIIDISTERQGRAICHKGIWIDNDARIQIV